MSSIISLGITFLRLSALLAIRLKLTNALPLVADPVSTASDLICRASLCFASPRIDFFLHDRAFEFCARVRFCKDRE